MEKRERKEGTEQEKEETEKEYWMENVRVLEERKTGKENMLGMNVGGE